jgi:hypothetical protein
MFRDLACFFFLHLFSYPLIPLLVCNNLALRPLISSIHFFFLNFSNKSILGFEKKKKKKGGFKIVQVIASIDLPHELNLSYCINFNIPPNHHFSTPINHILSQYFSGACFHFLFHVFRQFTYIPEITHS